MTRPKSFILDSLNKWSLAMKHCWQLPTFPFQPIYIIHMVSSVLTLDVCLILMQNPLIRTYEDILFYWDSSVHALFTKPLELNWSP